jgi:chromosome segregation ATPase
MEAIPGGVNDMQVQDVNTIVDLKVQLARIEEALKPLAALAPGLAEVREIAKEALQAVQQLNLRIVELEAESKKTADVAHEAKRNSAEALSRLDKHDEDQKWLKRTVYGAALTGITGLLIAAVWAGIKLGGM